MKVAKATDAKEIWPGKGPVMPTSHLHGGAIMGTERGEFSDQQLRPDPRNSESVDGRPLHLPDRGRVEPDLHDLRSVAARRGATGEDVVDGRRVIHSSSWPGWSRPSTSLLRKFELGMLCDKSQA